MILVLVCVVSSVEFIKQLPSAFNDFHYNQECNSNIASPQLLSNLAQQIARIENEMETAKAQRIINLDSLHENISDQCANSTLILMQEISLLKEQLNVISSTESQRNSNGKTKMIKDEKLHNKVFKMEDNFSAEILVIQSELKTIKQKQQQNTKWNVQDNPHAYAISTLKQKMSLLQQQIDDMTNSESGDLQKDVMDQITTIRADIAEKYSILETKIEHLEQSDRGNVNSHSMDGAKMEQIVDVWDKFMSQQTEMNQKFLDFLESTPQNPDGTARSERADFAVRAVYHTEIMASSMGEYLGGKLYYFFTRNYDQNAVRPTGRIGDCTALKQNENQDVYIIFRLRERLFVNGITIEYIRPSLAQNKIKSAPKNMTMEFSQDGYHYYKEFSGYLLYNPLVDGAKKYFKFSLKTKRKYQFAKLNVLSNHGAEYSCIYRVQIHGVVN